MTQVHVYIAPLHDLSPNELYLPERQVVFLLVATREALCKPRSCHVKLISLGIQPQLSCHGHPARSTSNV